MESNLWKRSASRDTFTKRDLQREVGHYKLLFVSFDLKMWHVSPQRIDDREPKCTSWMENDYGYSQFNINLFSPVEEEITNDADRRLLPIGGLLFDPLLDGLCKHSKIVDEVRKGSLGNVFRALTAMGDVFRGWEGGGQKLH
eukprot:Gb_40775 [translate_table: standard]